MRNLLLILAFAATTFADEPRRRPVLFRWENDSFGFLTRQFSDENYTNGLRLDVGSIGDPQWAKHLEEFYCGLSLCGDAAGRKRAVSYGFTHQFYTPKRIEIISRRPDRPWAGVMYASATLRLNDGDDVQHVLEGQLGILGQAAGAHYIQSRWHQLINYDVEPIGWPNQLRNEPILNVLYTYNRRFPLLAAGEHADITASPGFALGTLTTYPAFGVTARYGRNLAAFTTPAPIPAADYRKPPPVEAFLFAGADVRYVLNNATLDGGFFRNGPNVDRKAVVRDFRVGGSVRVHSFRLSYTIVKRSAEFTEQRPSEQTFHQVAIGYEP